MEILITIGFIYLYYTTSSLKISLSFVLCSSFASLVYAYFFNRDKVIQYLAFVVMIVIFGSFTLIFDDPKIYMLKTSFSFAILGTTILLWPIFMKRTLFEEIVTKTTCEQSTLLKVQYSSILVCFLIAILNAYVVNNYDMITWGKFKIGLGILTTIYCAICLSLISQPWKNGDSDT